MNKQELIDVAVEELFGDISNASCSDVYENNILVKYDTGAYYLAHELSLVVKGIPNAKVICSRSEFTQRARELGWCNGYKYGVEYETNGKKPDLPDDVFVDIKCQEGANRWQDNTDLKVSGVLWSRDKYDESYIPASHFKIIDQRYKPAEQSPEKSWHEKGELPPVDTVCEYYDADGWQKCRILAVDSKGLLVVELFGDGIITHSNDNACYTFRPLKTERERFVEAAIACLTEFKSANQVFGELYDAGFKAPEVVE